MCFEAKLLHLFDNIFDFSILTWLSVYHEYNGYIAIFVGLYDWFRFF